MSLKKSVGIVLLVFAVFSLGFAAGKLSGEKNIKNKLASANKKGVAAFYFYGNMRCLKCKTIEKWTKEIIEKNYSFLNFKAINVETAENEHYIEELSLTNKDVVLVKFDDNGKVSKTTKLSKLWELTKNKKAFTEYFQNETAKFMEDEK